MQEGSLQQNSEQLELAQQLDALRNRLIQSDRHVLPKHKLSVDMFSDATPKGLLQKMTFHAQRAVRQIRHYPMTTMTTHPKGLYIHGSVGVGKSLLMDLFVHSMTTGPETLLPNRQIRRIHFHEFMLEVHDRIHQSKLGQPKHDPLPHVALSMAQEARLLCLDEFQVTDIADAMILKRLFTMGWSSRTGMVVVATSNRDPDSLYEGGLNRSIFLPFIKTLHQNMNVVEMTGRTDYRRQSVQVALPAVEEEPSYYWPANDPSTRQALQRLFVQHGGGGGGEEQTHSTHIRLPVRMGRHVHVPKSNQNCAWFDFEDLCHQPLGAADYLSICERYKTLIVDHVPQLDGSKFNEARRFVTLIDAVYESKTRLILASNHVPLEELLVGFDATVESNDGDEEIAVDGISVPPDQTTTTATSPEQHEMFVKGEGGSSSSSSTTMIRSREGGGGGTVIEWSATGRIGVSLAQLSAVKDVSFSFQRAESRLAEINNGSWGR